MAGSGFFSKKIKGGSASVGSKKTGIMSKGFSGKTGGGSLIKSPRQAKGSAGNGMNGGH